jgi:hypothetical protein
MVDYSELEQRVELGAALLTKHFGHAGWKQKIDLDRLNIAGDDSCIIGQLFGDYGDGLTTVGAWPADARQRYGFTGNFDGATANHALTAIWKAYLGEMSA